MSKPFFPSLLSRTLAKMDDFSDHVVASRMEETLDQEIRRLDQDLKAVQEKISQSKAERIHAQQQVVPLKATQAELEEQAARLLRGRRKMQAKEKAVEIAKVAEQVLSWEAGIEKASLLEKEGLVEQGDLERRLKLRRYQLGALKASANLHRTQEALAADAQARPATARDALIRLKQAFVSDLPNPDEVLGEPPEPVAESPDEILARLSKSTSPTKAPKNPSKSRKS